MNNLDAMELIVDSLDVYIFCKDKSGKYIFSNEKFAEVAGVDSKEQLIGKTDADLIWREQEKYFRDGDLKVLSGGVMTNVPEVQVQVSGIKEITTSKNLLKCRDNRVEGIIGSFIENTGSAFVKKQGVYDPKKKRIDLGEYFCNEYLTFSEAKVYFYILCGYSNREISKTLEVAASTINYHTENLKTKLQCVSRGDLIAVGISTGLTYTVFNLFI